MRRALVVLALILLAADAAAQSWPPTEPGQAIRLRAPTFFGSGMVRARVVDWRPESLSMIRVSTTDSIEVPLNAIARLEVLEGKSRFRGAVTIGGILGLVGFGVGLATRDCEAWDDLCNGGFGAVYHGGGGMLVGALLGGLLGSQVPMDVWRRQELPGASGAGRER